MFYNLILENETGQQIILSKIASKFMPSKIEGWIRLQKHQHNKLCRNGWSISQLSHYREKKRCYSRILRMVFKLMLLYFFWLLLLVSTGLMWRIILQTSDIRWTCYALEWWLWMNFPSEPASALFFYGGESLTVIFNALEKQFWIKYNIIPYRIYCKRLFNKAFDSHNLLYLFAEHNDMCS